MRSKIAIYLAGSIKKGHKKRMKLIGTDADIHLITQSLSSTRFPF